MPSPPPARRHRLGAAGGLKAVFVPWSCCLLCFVLAGGTGWMQYASNDLLPSFMLGPAIIGAVAAGLTGVMSVVGFFLLRKGANYHDRKALAGSSHPSELRQFHPIQGVDYGIFGCGFAAALTEGAWLYMVVCVIVSDDDDYCVSMSLSATDCNESSGAGWIVAGVVLLLFAISLAYLYHSLVDKARQEFDENRAASFRAYGLDPDVKGSGTRRGKSGGGGRAGGGRRRDEEEEEEDEGQWDDDEDEYDDGFEEKGGRRGGGRW